MNGWGRRMLVTADIESPLLGRTAPLFSLPLFDGRTLRLEDLRGQGRATARWAAATRARRVPETIVRLKIDRTAYGPEPGKPVLLPGGMRGDRVQIIFSGPRNLKDFLVERCEGGV